MKQNIFQFDSRQSFLRFGNTASKFSYVSSPLLKNHPILHQPTYMSTSRFKDHETENDI